jgi:hypothetical protein
MLAVLALGPATSQAQVTIYTRGNAPMAPTLDSLPLKESVSQYGITWTFDKPTRVGQFVNGDYYVVGETTIKAIDPAPRFGKDVPEDDLDKYDKRHPVEKRIRNGSMVNPPASGEVAYDSGLRGAPHMEFKPELTVKLPVTIKPTDTLVSTISTKLGQKASFVYHSSGGRAEGDNCPIRVAAVLSCVAAPQPADAFRPAFCDRQQKIYLARDLQRDKLPALPRVKDAPDPAKFAEAFQKAWLNTGYFGFDQPMENMPHYGQWVGQAVGNAALLLCLDFRPEEKEKLLINFVQVGIDYWGAVKSGHPGWEGWGGHGSGRKLPIVLAGYLLGDEQMAAPTKAFPKVDFGEDNQTRYGKCWTGANVVFSGHSGISSATGLPPRSTWGPYEHLRPTQWDMVWTTKDGKKIEQSNNQSEAYRRSNTSCCWVGQGLALRILGLEKQWNHDAFFDYVDRWMTEDDLPARQVISKEFGDKNLVNPEKGWCHEGYTGEAWVKEVWTRYRSRSEAPTDGWKKDRGEEASQFGPTPEALAPGARREKLKAKLEGAAAAGDKAKAPATGSED